MSEGIIVVLLGSSVLVALITLIGNIIMFMLNRKAQKEDKSDKYQEDMSKLSDKLDQVIQDQDNLAKSFNNLSSKLDNVTNGQMYLLKKEIERSALKCIKSGTITLKTREELHNMHDVYHNKLGGNGGLDSIMNDVDDLPLSGDA